MAFEYVFELDKCSDIVDSELVTGLIEIGYHLIDGPFEAEAPVILMDFEFTFISWNRAK